MQVANFSQLTGTLQHLMFPSSTYLPSIRSKVTNYRQTNDENLDPDSLSCNCSSSTFKDQHHNHVVSGNLDKIQSPERRVEKPFKKGLNYRDQAPPNKQKAFSAVK